MATTALAVDFAARATGFAAFVTAFAALATGFAGALVTAGAFATALAGDFAVALAGDFAVAFAVVLVGAGFAPLELFGERVAFAVEEITLLPVCTFFDISNPL